MFCCSLCLLVILLKQEVVIFHYEPTLSLSQFIKKKKSYTDYRVVTTRAISWDKENQGSEKGSKDR